jgi:type I restriction enzyme, S subunit
MMSRWIESTLNEYLTFKNGKSSPERTDSGHLPVYGSNGVIGYSEKVNSPDHSLIVGRVGSYCGSVYHTETECWVTDNAIIGLPKTKEESEFWYYMLTALNLNNYRSGSGQPLLNQRTLNSISTRVPESSLQRSRIGRFLWSFDEKINLNQQINQTLESITQTIFKSWFVDFDPVKAKMEGHEPEGMDSETAALFPDKLMESDLGIIPEGWDVVRSGKVIDVRDGTHDSPKQADIGYPLVTSKHITSGELRLEDTYLISEKDYGKVNQRSNVGNGDILLTMIGTVGIPCLVMKEEANFAIKNIGLFRTSQSDTLRYYFYLLLKTPGMMNYLKARLAGTTQKYLSLKALRNIEFILPDNDLLNQFNDLVSPLFRMIHNNQLESQTLANLRDTLLPKLISGDIHIPDSFEGAIL